MSTVRLRPMLFTVLAFPFVAASLAAKPVELKDLKQELIRGRIKEFLAHPDAARRLDPLRGQVLLRDDQIIYTSVNGVPQRLEWRYETLPAYDPAAAAQVQAQLKDLLHEVLVRFDGGLLNEADAQFLLARTS